MNEQAASIAIAQAREAKRNALWGSLLDFIPSAAVSALWEGASRGKNCKSGPCFIGSKTSFSLKKDELRKECFWCGDKMAMWEEVKNE